MTIEIMTRAPLFLLIPQFPLERVLLHGAFRFVCGGSELATLKLSAEAVACKRSQWRPRSSPRTGGRARLVKCAEAHAAHLAPCGIASRARQSIPHIVKKVSYSMKPSKAPKPLPLQPPEPTRSKPHNRGAGESREGITLAMALPDIGARAAREKHHLSFGST